MISSSQDTQFIGIVVNPKTKEPVIVEKKAATFRTVTIRALTRRDAPVGFYSYVSVGEGYLASLGDEYLAPTNATGYPRVHTPHGVEPSFQGMGFGTCLYAGVCLLATARTKRLLEVPSAAGRGAAICSSAETRSDDADAWWDAAVDRDLASREEHEGDEDEDTTYDEDLLSYLSTRGRNSVVQAIHDAFGDTEYSVSGIEVRGNITSTARGESQTVDTLTYKSLINNQLVVTLDPIDDNFQDWCKRNNSEAIHTALEVVRADLDKEACKDIVLALNVARQDLRFVGKLALMAEKLGASEAEVAGMVMRQKFGYDEIVKEHKPPAFTGNPRKRKHKRGGPRHSEHGPGTEHEHAPPIDLHRVNPEPVPTDRELALLVEESRRLAQRRARLGWDALEALP